MVAIKALWGPFATTPRQSAYEKRFGEIRWYFFGVRADGRMGRWQLVWKSNERAYAANALEIKKIVGEATADYSDYLDASPHVWEGRLVDILRSQLTKDDIANVTRTTIEYRR